MLLDMLCVYLFSLQSCEMFGNCTVVMCQIKVSEEIRRLYIMLYIVILLFAVTSLYGVALIILLR